MALVVSSPPDIRAADPTMSLKQALADFGDILTEEQKRQFQASSTKPDVSSVIAFVGEVDANNSSTTRRCVAPRLYTFLDALQQFSRVVDTFVSSNPAIAALIWGGVKTAILTASNIASYFDKITSMVMAIGRSCPTYQQFGQLYPGCVALQRALCDYYAVIIQMCIKIIEVSRRTAIKQTVSSIFFPFDSEFKSFQDDLDQATKKIQLQISLASQQADKEARKLLEHESQLNTAFRRKLFKKYGKEHAEAHQWRIDMMKKKAARLKSDIKINLSTVDHTKYWKQATKQRVTSTAEWLLQEPLFRQWKDSPDTAIFWCSGTMGVGKTVLMSNVVTQLNASRKTNDIISYYFCRGDDAVTMSSRNIIGSLARQLLEQEIDHAEDDSLQDLHRDSCGLNTDEVVNFILAHLKDDKSYYLVLDGLDECDNSQIIEVARSVTQFCNVRPTGFRIICAGRPELEEQLFRVTKPKYKLSVTERKIKADMDHYIDTILGRCLEEELLKLQDPMLIINIAKALRDGSHGMFLWTRLFVEELCAQGSDNDILAALKHLPRGLSEIFDRKIRRLRERPAAKEAMKTLQFCSVAKRPLTVMEYQEVLSLAPGQKSLDRGKMPNDITRVVGDCCGLAFIDEEDSTVHYVHHSVKQHLSTTNNPQLGDFDLARIDQHFGFLCMTYLDFTDFRRQLAKTREDSNVPINPIQLGTLSIRQSSRSARLIALKLLPHSRHLQHLNAQEIERKTQDVLGNLESSRLESEILRRKFHFFNYAWTFWVDHTTDLDPDTDHMMWRLYCRCVEGNDISASRPWESEQQNNDWTSDLPNAIQWSLTHRNHTLLQYYARCQSHIIEKTMKRGILGEAIIHNQYRFVELLIQHVNVSSEDLRDALLRAAKEGHLEIVKTILAAEADVNVSITEAYEQTALKAAAEAGHSEIVERLLAAGAYINAPATGHNGRTALQGAARAGHSEIVKRLIAAGADINTPVTEYYQRTALQGAAEAGHLEIVERLLAAGADINTPATKYYQRTALQGAAEAGHLKIVERLLAAGADVNAPATEHYGRTALQGAAEAGHAEIVERLLAAGADVNVPATGPYQRTALQGAAREGHSKIVERLLAAGADINAPATGSYGQTALQGAAREGHSEIVERLLAAGADINAPATGSYGQTALQGASKAGHYEIVERFLAAGADANMAANDFRETALQGAARAGHLKIVERLLAAGADANMPADEFGETALQGASRAGHSEIVKRLLAAGAV